MKHQWAAMLAATAVLGVTTAFGANPFSDVTPDSWAYQSVSQLASAGIINGYPDGTFKGQKGYYSFRNGPNDCKGHGQSGPRECRATSDD